mgnify:CR=1 FL=1
MTGSPAASSSVRSHGIPPPRRHGPKCTLSVMKEKTFTVRDGGVKSGPFKVLLGANIPGILVEVGYCSNAQEAANLAIPTYRQALRKGSLPASLPIWAASTGTSADPVPLRVLPRLATFPSQPCSPLPLSRALREKRKRCSVLLE